MKIILSVVGGLVAWALIATLLDRSLRLILPDYAAAELVLAFTLSMKIARLSIAVVASLAAGVVTRTIVPANRWVPWVVGVILLLAFLPVHIQIGQRLPLWYHLFFLLTLAPFVALGARTRDIVVAAIASDRHSY